MYFKGLFKPERGSTRKTIKKGGFDRQITFAVGLQPFVSFRVAFKTIMAERQVPADIPPAPPLQPPVVEVDVEGVHQPPDNPIAATPIAQVS